MSGRLLMNVPKKRPVVLLNLSTDEVSCSATYLGDARQEEKTTANKEGANNIHDAAKHADASAVAERLWLCKHA